MVFHVTISLRLTIDVTFLVELSDGWVTETGHNCIKPGHIHINGSVANSRAIMAATGLTPTHCHCHSTVLITPCWGQFNWTNPIRAQERSGLLSSTPAVIEADGRKIKMLLLNHALHIPHSLLYLFVLAKMNYGKSYGGSVSRSCSSLRTNRAEDMLCKCFLSKCNGVKWCMCRVSCWIFLFNYVLMNCDNVGLRGEMSMKYLLEI